MVVAKTPATTDIQILGGNPRNLSQNFLDNGIGSSKTKLRY